MNEGNRLIELSLERLEKMIGSLSTTQYIFRVIGETEGIVSVAHSHLGADSDRYYAALLVIHEILIDVMGEPCNTDRRGSTPTLAAQGTQVRGMR